MRLSPRACRADLGLQPGQDAQRLRVALEAAARPAPNSSSARSPLCPNGGCPMSWASPASVHDVGVAAQLLGDLAADLGDLQRVREPGPRDAADLGPLPRPDDLGLAGQPAQRRRVQHPGAVPGERAAPRRPPGVLRRLGLQPGPVVRGVAGVGRRSRARCPAATRQPSPLVSVSAERVGEPVVQQRGGLPDDVAGLGLPGLHHRSAAGRRRPRLSPASRAMVRARSECHGSLTTSAVCQPSRSARGADGLQAAQGVRALADGDDVPGRHPAVDQVAPPGLGLGGRRRPNGCRRW